MKNGFSILELMITVAVVGIIAGVGYPVIGNFGKIENYQSDLATIRGQINIIRQFALENGHAYRLQIVNDDVNNESSLEVWRAQGLDRFNTEFHNSTIPPCSEFGGSGNKGVQETELTKQLEYFVIKKCNSLTGSCEPVSVANNYFCFLPDGSSPENTRASIVSTGNAGNKTEFIHFYKSGFFNNGERM
ncbi:prepilin-type N-terminal cleavage/methylation domain-containing protein [Candidatus Pelagibacter sp.]|nr:prepilin-type N-terminal cleavage/methylation domain-containing protein [Candidatus Pelagibacter sp.]